MQIVYLHGFASGPTSRKAVAFADHYGKRGINIERVFMVRCDCTRQTIAAR